MQAEGLDGVVEQTGDGHRADTLWHRRNGQSAVFRAVEIDIADELAFTVYLDAVDADIDHVSPILHPVAGDELRAADGGDQNIGGAAALGPVLRFRVRDGDRAVLV